MSFNFLCYFPGQNPCVVDVDVGFTDWTYNLSKAIKKELKLCGRDVSLADLCLYKTDVPLNPRKDLQRRALEWLQQQPVNSWLPPKKLTALFSDGCTHTSDDRLDIIIINTEVLDLIKGNSDKAFKRKDKEAFEKCLNDRLPPSSSSLDIILSPQKQKQLLAGVDPPICRGGVPVAIFNPALATLQSSLQRDRLEQVEVSCGDVDLAKEYTDCVVKFYSGSEVILRSMLIKEVIEKVIGKSGKWRQYHVSADNSKPEGPLKPHASWWHDEFLTLVLELKNTLGLSGDANLQAVLEYAKIITQRKYDRFWNSCNFPVVLVSATGNRIEISIAACIGTIYVSRLLLLDVRDNTMVHLARVFKVLSVCQRDLEEYYDRVSKSAPPSVSGLFPDPTLVDLSKALPKLTYQKFLTQSGQTTSDVVDIGQAAMYTAILDGTHQEVVIKFTADYNELAHRLLAVAQLAPKLHFCERIVGDLYMVVMDRVDGKSIWQLKEDRTPVPAIVADKVEEALLLLHKNEIVFGDLRDPNILYVEPEGSNEARVVLVDFDWAGEDEKSRYPAFLNCNNTWHEGVMPYGIMRKEHDLWQLDRLQALCNS